jgi:hypothetical protein
MGEMRDRMLRGELYIADDPENAAVFARVLELLAQFNGSAPGAWDDSHLCGGTKSARSRPRRRSGGPPIWLQLTAAYPEICNHTAPEQGVSA